MRRSKQFFLWSVVGTIGAIGNAGAVTLVPMSIEQLARGSEACVLGTVTSVTSLRTAAARIETVNEISITEVLHGTVGSRIIALHEPGGTVDGWHESFDASPQYAVGERVVIFVGRRRDGSYRTSHLLLGKFAISDDEVPRTYQRLPEDAVIIAPSGVTMPQTSISLDELRRMLNEMEPEGPFGTTARPPRSYVAHGASGPEIQLLGSRFDEPDQSLPLSFLIDARGDSILGINDSFTAIRQAIATWTNVDSAAIQLVDGGTTTDLSGPCPGPHVVLFDDPHDDIPPPQECSGILGIGGNCATDAETKVMSGRSFLKGQRAILTLADDWEGCPQWTPCNIAEIATHELGHALGLAHSSEREDESDPILRNATMYFRASFDGRCAGVREYDVAAVSLVYPTALPPTILTSSPLPSGTALMPYQAALQATGGSGELTWELIEGGFPGLVLSSGGLISGSPQALGNSFFRVRATDTHGDSHTKLFDITVRQQGDCPANCDGSGAVGMNDLITLVNIVLGKVPITQCPAAVGADSLLRIEDLVLAVDAAHSGCGA